MITKKSKCWNCNKDIKVQVEEYYNPYKLTVYDKEWNSRKNINKREFCNECKRDHDKRLREIRQKSKELEAELRMERAIRIMERQNIHLYEYRDAIKLVSSAYNNELERFRSAEEIVATIILIQHGIAVKNNFKIGKYKADIYIQSLTCIVEIDGFLHNNEKAKLKDGNKDIYIRSALGREWEIVRIPTKYIETKAENLISAIIEVKSTMMELREENCGFLPYDFSESMNAVYRRILKGVKN